MKVLFIGDVIGPGGCRHLEKHLNRLKKDRGIDVCIANGENSAEGNGITPGSAQELYNSGVDVITTGNHVFRHNDIYPELEKNLGLIRPGNFHKTAPGVGVYVLDKLRYQLCIINIQGQAFMESCANPFEYMDEILLSAPSKNIVVDFHAEATSEKKAMGYYLDGRVSAVLGTHTHVQTADERILAGGTAYITDVGMCGGENSVLGVKKEIAINKLLYHLPVRFEYDQEGYVMNGVILDIDSGTGRALAIERISL